MKTNRVLFLYTEVAGYFLACVRRLAELRPDFQVHIVRSPVNPEAPYEMAAEKGILFHDRESLGRGNTFVNQLEELAPAAVFCSGWTDSDYLRFCRKIAGKIPTVLILDNPWRGTLRQQVGRVLSPFLLLNRFSHAWVPGEPQVQFARKLGFKHSQIHTGFYCADLPLYQRYGEKALREKEKHFPKRFLYAGRYVTLKGIEDLWRAFAALDSAANEWELWCLGAGPLHEERIEHPRIRHFGFVQPSEMERFIRETGVFVLPSHYEPWAVAVQEFAAAGFPLLLSDKVCAGDVFLDEPANGWRFPAGDIKALKNKLERFVMTQDDELLEMGKRSMACSERITPDQWAATVQQMIERK